MARLIRMSSFGAAVHGPMGHLFYGFLERNLPGSTPPAVMRKVRCNVLYTRRRLCSYEARRLGTLTAEERVIAVPAYHKEYHSMRKYISNEACILPSQNLDY
jgi:hypothetical protein